MSNLLAYENIDKEEERSVESDSCSDVSGLFESETEPEAHLRNNQVRAFSEVLPPNALESVTNEPKLSIQYVVSLRISVYRLFCNVPFTASRSLPDSNPDSL